MAIAAVNVSLGATFHADTPRRLFTPGIYSPDATFDVTADGERFVLPAALDFSKVESPSLFPNWVQGVGHQVPELP